MKNRITASVLVLLLVLGVGCTKKATTETSSSGTPFNFSVSEKAVLSSTNSFAINLFSQLGDTATTDLFFSPLSIALDLTMVYNGAEDSTALQMQQVLGYGQMSNLAINQACHGLMQQLLESDPSVTLNLANSIWYRNTMTVKDSFITVNQTYLSAQVEAADFTNPNTVTLINNWAANETDQKITSVLTKISPADMMYLLNAIYFHGNWSKAFNASNTAAQNFTLSDGTPYSTPFMNQTGSFPFYSNDLFSSAMLPYGNGNYSMVILVPSGNNTPKDILDKLTPASWNSWNASYSSTGTTTLSIPKFSVRNQLNLNNTLENMGMTDAFYPTTANFSGISSMGLYISYVDHDSYISIDETGTTAAAVTITGISTAVAIENKNSLIANKPFLFVIKENTTNTILFAGIIEKPVPDSSK